MKKIATISISVLLLVLILVGCGTPTTEKLMSQVATKMTAANSYAMSTRMVTDIGMKLGETEMDMKMEVTLDTDMTFDPMTVKVNGTLFASMFGLEESETIELFGEMTDGKYYIYSKGAENADGWVKELFSTPEAGNPLTGLSAYSESFVIAKDTETVNGKDCYVLTADLGGDALTFLIGLATNSPGGSAIPFENSDSDDVALPVSMYIDKKDSVPVRIAIDFTAFSAAFLGEDGMDGADAEYREFSLTMDFSAFNSIEPVQIPLSVRVSAQLTGDALNIFADGEIDWENAQLALQGNKLSLPVAYSELLALGFVLDEFYNNYEPVTTLSPDDYPTHLYINVPEGTFETPFVIEVEAPGDIECAVEDGIVTAVSIQNRSYAGNEFFVDVVLPGNIRMGSNKDASYAVLGKPEFETETATFWRIQLAEGSRSIILDYGQDNTVTRMRIGVV
jgi:hypothetical protein